MRFAICEAMYRATLFRPMLFPYSRPCPHAACIKVALKKLRRFIFGQEPNGGRSVCVSRGARLDFLDLFRFAFAFYFAEFWRRGNVLKIIPRICSELFRA